MNESSNNSEKTPLSEEKMDVLLRDFFRLETPAVLNQPFRAPAMNSRASVVPAEPTVRSVSRDQRQIRGRGLVVTGALCTLTFALLVSLRPPEAGKPSFTGSRVLPVPTPTELNVDSLMSVSPQGDLKSSAQPISDDGTTLEETDSIELHPKK